MMCKFFIFLNTNFTLLQNHDKQSFDKDFEKAVVFNNSLEAQKMLKLLNVQSAIVISLRDLKKVYTQKSLHLETYMRNCLMVNIAIAIFSFDKLSNLTNSDNFIFYYMTFSCLFLSGICIHYIILLDWKRVCNQKTKMLRE